MKKTTRIVIETKGGFRFGYERTVEKPDLKEIKQPVTVTPISVPAVRRLDVYA